jgi:hypothetical protein
MKNCGALGFTVIRGKSQRAKFATAQLVQVQVSESLPGSSLDNPGTGKDIMQGSIFTFNQGDQIQQPTHIQKGC